MPWTGRDLLREEPFLERLAPRLEGIDELIFLFGSVGDADAARVSPSDPSEHALEAFAKVVDNLGWSGESDRIVFARRSPRATAARAARRPQPVARRPRPSQLKPGSAT